jgi:hypothetical protein
MTFPAPIRDDALVASGRHCCLCHKFCGLKLELHHIVQKAEGGADTFDNCIPLCFDCHGDMRSYDHKHPKGTKYTPSELKRHRDNWYSKVKASPGSSYTEKAADLDRAVFTSLRESLPYGGAIRFLDTHHFGGPFSLGRLDEFDAFLEKSGDPSNEFIDVDLEGMRVKLIKDIGAFLHYVSINTAPTTGNFELQRVPSEQPERFDRVVGKIHELSSLVVDSYSILIRESRRRLGVLQGATAG